VLRWLTRAAHAANIVAAGCRHSLVQQAALQAGRGHGVTAAQFALQQVQQRHVVAPRAQRRQVDRVGARAFRCPDPASGSLPE